MTLREKIEREAKITVHAEQDDMPVRGNALASGDDAQDKRVEDDIIERLDSGDVWAWASVEVRGTWNGLEASAYLGCCCYEDESDFCKPGGYFPQMRDEVIDELTAQAEKIVNAAVE